MQSYLLLPTLPSSFPFSSSNSTLLPFCPSHIYSGIFRNKFRPLSASAINGNINYYDLLGVSRNSSNTDVKRAYRLLARKYHPDVSKDLQASQIFKDIHAAYEVLSNDVTRAEYDRDLRFEQSKIRRNWSSDYNSEHTQQAWASTGTTTKRWRYYYNTVDVSDNQSEVREPFFQLLVSIFLMSFSTTIFGFPIGLTLCALSKFFNAQLDGVYKMGYAVSCFLGGQTGLFLMVCISIVSWMCPKRENLTHFMVAVWVGSVLSKHLFVPQGALIALMHMSMNIQVHPRWWEWSSDAR